MKPDGYYKCRRCEGSGIERDQYSHDQYASYLEIRGGGDCIECRGSGSVKYINGMTESEHYARNSKPLEYYEEDTCFPYTALVETPFGRVPIGDLSEGEMVLSYSNGILVPRLITRKLVYGESPLVKINFEAGGNSLLSTVSHSFLTDKGWLAVKKIKPGDKIVRVNTSSPEQGNITSIIPTGIKEPVFNLYTQDEHNFIVDGCVAHNFTHFRLVRVILHRLFLDNPPVAMTQNVVGFS